jgi:two-component system, sensor histidine kinase PdtaS
VSDLVALAHEHSETTPAQLRHLRALVADWGVVSDLAFADLVLWLPTWNGGGYIAVAHRRPETGRTIFLNDVIGEFVPKGRRPVIDRAMVSARAQQADIFDGSVSLQVYPISHEGKVIALLGRYTATTAPVDDGRLEHAYRQSADDLCAMVVDGSFPVPNRDPAMRLRVGGGLLRLDPDGIVEFATPNATSAFRRLGSAVDLVGASLARLALRIHDRADGSDPKISRVASGRIAGRVELEHGQSTVVLEVIPVLAQGKRTSAIVLVRDISELRSRERALVSTEASLRELHHRIKNNLQMVAALLRLQSRRADSEEARGALAEAGQRIGAIAVVHEVLAVAPDDLVDFDQVVDRIIDMTRQLAPDARIRREGRLGKLLSETATPLALCVAELVSNAIEHGAADVVVNVRLRRTDSELNILVEDNGPGLPGDMTGDSAGGLGMQIVRTLVEENSGFVRWEARGAGTSVEIRFPLSRNNNRV